MNAKAKLIAMLGAPVAVAAITGVAYFEGYVPTVYRDPIGRLAACYGHDNQALTPGASYTRQQCEDILAEDLVRHARALECIAVPLTDGQKAALVSFAFNVGADALCGSTLARKANSGRPASDWCNELLRWNRAGGKVLPGLTKRRQAERTMCLTGQWPNVG